MEELKADYFCQQREVGILNIGGKGTITVDGKEYQLSNLDCLYIGRSSKKITFQTTSQEKPALFYLLSYPAHKKFPTQLAKIKDAEAVHIGSQNESNERTIYKFVHPNGIQSCQLVMGITLLKPGSVWNTMPCHNHKRRMEVYLYFNMDENSRVFHFCGMPNETRHIVLKKNEAVISPSWSIHSGVGTGAYAFCWGMGGENQDFSDMNHIPMDKLR
jgi:4-deoxy-L-threo-5-hexosulose-uronate ketol-isomerase